MLFPDETGAAALQVLAAAALAVGLAGLLDWRATAHRALFLAVSTALGLRYLHWRVTETLPAADAWASYAFFALEAMAFLSAVSAAVLMARHRDRGAEADAGEGWWGTAPPRVVVLIATYNEDAEVLERTLVGAAAIDHPAFEVWLLDDGNRPEMARLARRHGARHVTRPDNAHAKAGNINHALALMRAEGKPPDFVAVLDADFVAHDGFLRRTLALFREADVALVQTPQHFFNPDPIQHNLGLSAALPDEQRFFFEHIQPARDGWGLAICCGTSSVARWEALEAIGFMPTDSVTEDFLLTLALAERGWRTVYLNEPLTEGLAPEGLAEYVTQRARWCLGLMQIARGRLGPLGRNGLSLAQRWSVVDSMLYWAFTYPFRIVALIAPVLYWYANLLVVDADVPGVLSHFGVWFVWSMIATHFLARGAQLPFVTEVSALVAALPITASAWSGLLSPGGRAFKVTDKGGDRSRRVVQWRLMAPFLALFLLTAGGLVIGVVWDRFAHWDAGDGKAVILFWSVWNLLLLGLAVRVCIEEPRRERHLNDPPRRGRAVFGRVRIPVRVDGLTSAGARLRGIGGAAGEALVVEIAGVGALPAVVRRSGEGEVAVLFRHSVESRRRLLLHLHARGGAPGTARADLSTLLSQALLGVAPRRGP
jgi:cellulose synthase (UDP-forming)